MNQTELAVEEVVVEFSEEAALALTLSELDMVGGGTLVATLC